MLNGKKKTVLSLNY